MELKLGDLVQHFHSGMYGIVVKAPSKYKYKGCVVCEVLWCNNNKINLIDVDYLDKIKTS